MNWKEWVSYIIVVWVFIGVCIFMICRNVEGSNAEWFIDSYPVYVTSWDGEKMVTEKTEYYLLVYSTKEDNQRLEDWKKMTKRAVPAAGIAYGEIEESDINGIPTKQNFNWRIVLDAGTAEDVETLKEFVKDIPINKFPYKFTVILHYPRFNVYRMYLYYLYEDDLEMHKRVLEELS